MAICLQCGVEFPAARSTAKFCNPAHKKAYQRGGKAGNIEKPEDSLVKLSSAEAEEAQNDFYAFPGPVHELPGDELTPRKSPVDARTKLKVINPHAYGIYRYFNEGEIDISKLEEGVSYMDEAWPE